MGWTCIQTDILPATAIALDIEIPFEVNNWINLGKGIFKSLSECAFIWKGLVLGRVAKEWRREDSQTMPC